MPPTPALGPARDPRPAAAGSSNREIVEALFITTKTVETHLRSAYRKVGIHSRAELCEAL